MTIPEYQIIDKQSFDDTTQEPNQVAGLYFFYKLDCLIELAHQVSFDFYRRPELFTDLTKNVNDTASAVLENTITPILAKLNARYGADETFLDYKQRYAIYSSLFGNPINSETDEECNFPCLRDELMDACARFVETKFGDEDSLRDAVRQAQSNFQQYITGLHGDSVRWSKEGPLSFLTEQVVYSILRNRGVSGRYAIQQNPVNDWPYIPDANGAKLVEAIAKELTWPGKYIIDATMDGKDFSNINYITRDQFTTLQQIALKGTRAIATSIGVDPNGPDVDIDALINRVYTWNKALQKIHGYSKTYQPGVKPAQKVKERGASEIKTPRSRTQY